jgi:hypothetical protein
MSASQLQQKIKKDVRLWTIARRAINTDEQSGVSISPGRGNPSSLIGFSLFVLFACFSFSLPGLAAKLGHVYILATHP